MRLRRLPLLRPLAIAGIMAVALSLVFIGTAFSVGATPAARPVTPGTQHILGTRNTVQQAQGTTNMTYHGGPVETAPAVYISWWGPEWASGFSTGGYTSAQAQTYLSNFFSNVGGSSWENIVTQYCQGVANGTVNCGTKGTHIQNLTGQLKGTWNDTTTVPSRPTQANIASAAVRLMQHFGYHANATYFVFTPHGKSQSGFGTQWCAYHSVSNSSSGEVAWAYMPYQPDAGASCGMNFVNGSNNSYGNGYFDGFSIVGGHEYAEAETDPHTASGQYAWYDSSGAEIGDKCAWSPSSRNITLGSHFYAVQPLWSNVNTACETSH
ncbi:MAG TPA: hypothetical protein VGS80_12970 [Ktedonobacterales bacterium]|nr:hypothetical protein [Ktedonobacterales bacterium]